MQIASQFTDMTMEDTPLLEEAEGFMDGQYAEGMEEDEYEEDENGVASLYHLRCRRLNFDPKVKEYTNDPNTSATEAIQYALTYPAREIAKKTSIDGARSESDFLAGITAQGLSRAQVLTGSLHPDDLHGNAMYWVAEYYENTAIASCINKLYIQLHMKKITDNAMAKRIQHAIKARTGMARDADVSDNVEFKRAREELNKMRTRDGVKVSARDGAAYRTPASSLGSSGIRKRSLSTHTQTPKKKLILKLGRKPSAEAMRSKGHAEYSPPVPSRSRTLRRGKSESKK